MASNRNPSPPPISEKEADVLNSDTIGDTVFSKRWVLRTLFKLTETIRKSGESQNDHDSDDALDGELCKLWDMSMNKDVAAFLQEVDGIDILLEIVIRSSVARLTEISIGILANMACQTDICNDMSNRDKLIEVMLMVLDNRDAPTLVEVTRLLHAAVSNDASRDNWIGPIQRSSLFDNLTYILENTLNEQLLLNCSLLLSSLLKHSEGLLGALEQQRLQKAVLEAIKQNKNEMERTKDSLLFLHQLISPQE